MNALASFLDDLVDWYWKYGCLREARYEIPRAQWLGALYDARDRLQAQAGARAQSRPAMAVWGPSQTGKSTLVSAFIDAKAQYVEREGEDGAGGALHWPGGYPMFFMAPNPSAPVYMNRYVLNPFNQGWDGSSCLSRFVLGSPTPREGFHHVRDVQHPVGLHFLSQMDLLNVTARGYDTECLGPTKSRQQTIWRLDTFEQRCAKYRRPVAQGKAPSRAAFETLHTLTQVLEDMVFAGLERFKPLLEEGDERWLGLINGLLGDPGYYQTVENVEALAADLLWDNYPILTEYYKRMRTELQALDGAWASRPAYCSMPAALVFLNMAASKIAFLQPPPSDPDTANYVLHRLIVELGWRDAGAHIEVGCGAAYPNKFATSPERFSMVQGLVWELVIPLNPENLPESNFKEFLHESDLLDFAGVGNEPKNDFSRIDLARLGGEKREGEPVPFEPELFFTRIIKRGKTASIVSSYAKRLTIDGFSIFQNIDAFPAVNAPQLINGIQTWWKYMVPDYFREMRGPSPLPLNLGLMWWAKRLNEGQSRPEEIPGSYEAHLQTLGPIGDPEKASLFAFNYHRFPRGRILFDFDPESKVYHAIVKNAKFRKQFTRPESLKSFEEMASDKVSGGAGYYFAVIREQLRKVRALPATNRLKLLELKDQHVEAEAEGLVNLPNLFPPPETVDLRKVMLEKLRDNLRAAVVGKGDREVRHVEHALREFLDVNPAVLAVPPADPRDAGLRFVNEQLNAWVAAQVARYDRWDASGRRTGPDWSLLGLHTREEFRDTLEALTASIQPCLDEVVEMLQGLLVATAGMHPELRHAQVRRHLAVALGNELVRRHTNPGEELEGFTEEGPADADRTGTDTAAWSAFLAPFVESQLAQFLRDRTGKLERPKDIPGDKDLLELCKKHLRLPKHLQGAPKVLK